MGDGTWRETSPPWVEQYLYHLSRGITKCSNDDSTRGWLDQRRSRLLWVREFQHREMRKALYNFGHPLWRRVK